MTADPQPALLTYDISTDPFPLHANAANVVLTIVATNNSTKDVPLEGISIVFPVGTAGAHLTNAGGDIVAIAPEGFDTPGKNESEGYMKFMFDQEFKLKPRQAVTFIFNKINVNTATGTAEIRIMEYAAAVQRIKKLNITKFPNAWGKVSFMVENTVISYDGQAAMHWDGPAGATYTIEYYSYKDKKVVKVPGIGEAPLSNKGRYPSVGESLKLNKTTEFSLNVELVADGNTYSAQEQKVVTVMDPPLPEFGFAHPTLSVIEGREPETITLNWTVENAVLVELDDPNKGTVDVTGKNNHKVVTNHSGVYKLKAFAADMVRYITKAFEVMTYSDFLNYHRFSIVEHEDHVIRPTQDYTEYGDWCDLEEKLTFYTNGEGKYQFLEVETVYTNKWGYEEVMRDDFTVDFKWKVVNGEIVCDLNAYGRFPAEQFVCIYNRDYRTLFYTKPPARLTRRKSMALRKDRIQGGNSRSELPEEFISSGSKGKIKPISLES